MLRDDGSLLDTSDTHFMVEALKEAQKAFDREEVPVGCVIVHKNRIIARAHNQIVTLKDPTAHAEMIALTQAASALGNERLNGCSLYATIEPCSMCAGAMVLARIDTLIYGANDQKAGACGSVLNVIHNERLNHQVNVRKGVAAEESRLLLQEFFKKKRALRT